MKNSISTRSLLIALMVMSSVSCVEARDSVETGVSVKDLRTRFAQDTKAGPQLESPGAKDARLTISAARGKAAEPAAQELTTTRSPIETGAAEGVSSLRSNFDGTKATRALRRKDAMHKPNPHGHDGKKN